MTIQSKSRTAGRCFALLLFAFALLGKLAFAEDRALTIHGFLTQAYAASDGNTIFGIPDEGTTDYRNAALQFRYSATERDSIVLQLSHERLGDSKLNDFQSDVELDWAFIQHSFNDDTWIKVGRVQIPIGIYNEVRDVGTILPFYRPSPNVYGDRSYTSETVDGAVGFRRFFRDSSWPVEVSGYYGGWNFVKDNQITMESARIQDAFGAQIWINTPIEGLRFGIHRSRLSSKDGALTTTSDKTEKSNVWYLSADANFEKAFFRTEFRDQGFSYGYWRGFYAQAGYNLTEKIAVAAQYDLAKIRYDQRPYFFANEEWDRDVALSFRYFFAPNLVTRFETHWDRGKYPSDPIAYLGIDKPLHTFYFILSVSASF